MALVPFHWAVLRKGDPPQLDTKELGTRTSEISADRERFHFLPSNELKGKERTSVLGIGQDFDKDQFEAVVKLINAHPGAIPKDFDTKILVSIGTQIDAVQFYATIAQERCNDAWDSARAMGLWVGERITDLVAQISAAADNGNTEAQLAMAMFRQHDADRAQKQQSQQSKVERARGSLQDQIAELIRKNDELIGLVREKDTALAELRHEVTLLKGQVTKPATPTRPLPTTGRSGTRAQPR